MILGTMEAATLLGHRLVASVQSDLIARLDSAIPTIHGRLADVLASIGAFQDYTADLRERP